MSGRQLFTIDDFRGTGRPLLAVLADPKSIFMSGLARFKRRTLYANVIHDRTAVYYTTCIAKTNPYADLDKVNVNYVPGYEDVVLDPANPVVPRAPKADRATWAELKDTGRTYVKNAPLVAFLVVFIPVAVLGYLVNSVIQTFRSSRRIQLHESGLAGIPIEHYRMPVMQELQQTVEDAYENVNSAHRQEYLASSDDDDDDALTERERKTLALERRQSHSQPWPTLALAPEQFEMIKSLDELGWRKYPVWIHKVRHSHAAMIVRTEKPSFSEGHIVMKHWIEKEFLM